MIIQSRNVWHRWTSFLKETKLESWKGWKLSWRNLCSLCLLTQCASSCLFVRVTFFYSTVCVWQWRRDHKRRQFYWVTSFIQWASQFPGSLRKAPAALSQLHTIVCLWIHWVVRRYLVCWIFWMLPQEPHFAINPPELYWSEEKFWNEFFLIFQVSGLSLSCTPDTWHILYFLILLKISRSELFESNLFDIRERLILSFH